MIAEFDHQRFGLQPIKRNTDVPAFQYRALTASGDRTKGEIEAADERGAIQALQAQGLLPIEAKPKASSLWSLDLGSGTSKTRATRVSPGLMIFTRELATLLRAGEPLVRAMALLSTESGDKALSQALSRIVDAVRGGRSLAASLEAEPSLFPRVYVGMVSAGEATGQLHQALSEVASLAERQEEARRKFIQSITYPTILTIVALAAVGFMLGLVVPQFAPLLEGHEARLPAATVFVLDLSELIRSQGTEILVILAAFLIGALVVVQIDRVRQSLDAAILTSRFLGRIPKERVTAQLARALGTLLRGGLDLPASLAMSAEMIDNSAARASLSRALTKVRQGQRLADALSQEQILAPMGQRILRTGEESGRLGELSLYLADQMDRRIADRTARLLAIMEPFLVVFMGLIVGGITVAILSAMLSVNELAI